MHLCELTESLSSSREFLLRHHRGLPEEQWDGRLEGMPKTVREIVQHMLENDAGSRQGLGGSGETFSTTLAGLEESNRSLLRLLEENWANDPEGALEKLSGGAQSIAHGTSYRQIEDYYHAGQIAWLRLKLQPDWEYFDQVYVPWEAQ